MFTIAMKFFDSYVYKQILQRINYIDKSDIIKCGLTCIVFYL